MARLHRFVKKARREVLSEKADICELFFTRSGTQRACRLFIEWMRKAPFGRTRSELSQFAKDLQAGHVEKGFRYLKSSFYVIIRKRLLELGFLALAPRSKNHGYVYKYVLVHQPIPKRGPDGWSFACLSWILCNRWNQQIRRREDVRRRTRPRPIS